MKLSAFAVFSFLLAGCSSETIKASSRPPSLPAAVRTAAVRLEYPSEAFPKDCDKFVAAMNEKASDITWKCRRKGKGDAEVDVRVDWSREGEASGPSLRQEAEPFGPGRGTVEPYDTAGSTSPHQNADAVVSVIAEGVAPTPFKYHLSIEERGNGFRSDLYDALLDLLARRLAADLTSGRAPLKDERRVEWLPIRGGSFLMGGGERSNAKPRHLVSVPSFEMAKKLVTFGQYAKCVAAGACTPAHTGDGTCYVYDAHTSTWGNGMLPDTFETDDQPAVCVDWAQAGAFSKWAGGRLPTEAEFEYAARSGGREQDYPWGDEAPSCDRAAMSVGEHSCARKSTWPVCSKTEGNSEQGLCDMTGNASEWMEDWYHNSYADAPADGSAQARPGTRRVIRGASWAMDTAFAPARVRAGKAPETISAAIGFRPAK